MEKTQTAREFGHHLAALVTPQDISRYHQVLLQNEEFIAREVEYYVQQRVKRLVDAADCYLKTRPPFTLKPLGAENSAIRLEQNDQIAAADELASAIAQLKGEKAGE